jgi:hypothetical protein
MIDKQLVKQTFIEGATESRQFIDYLEKEFGREALYRLLFNYPKKWSKRKVKKRGSQEMEFLRLDYGVEFAAQKVRSLGGEYSRLFTEEGK